MGEVAGGRVVAMVTVAGKLHGDLAMHGCLEAMPIGCDDRRPCSVAWRKERERERRKNEKEEENC